MSMDRTTMCGQHLALCIVLAEARMHAVRKVTNEAAKTKQEKDRICKSASGLKRILYAECSDTNLLQDLEWSQECQSMHDGTVSRGDLRMTSWRSCPEWSI